MMKSNISLPIGFIDELSSFMNREEFTLLVEALTNSDSPTSIRLNPNKPFALDYLPISNLIPFSDSGYYLGYRPSFTADPLLHAGCYYVQEASSMSLYAISELIDRINPQYVLDFCAAPGGKSTLLRTILPDDCVLVSNEVIPSRASVLKENIQKWGTNNHIITSSYPDKWSSIDSLFDIILVDAPCSGEGMFRKDIGAIQEWNPSSPLKCRERQREILDVAWQMLKPNGYLIYSTCTFNKKENEEQLDYMTTKYAAQSIAIDLLEKYPYKSPYTDYYAYRFMPHYFKGEGLFLSLLQKVENKIHSSKSKQQKKKDKREIFLNPLSKDLISAISPFLKENTNIGYFIDKKKNIIALSSELYTLYDKLYLNDINLLSVGTLLGMMKQQNFLPHSTLALSSQFALSSYPTAELSIEEALRYLRREVISLPSTPLGFICVTYLGHPLGFVKNIGSRCNNLYPHEWRILKQLDSLI